MGDDPMRKPAYLCPATSFEKYADTEMPQKNGIVSVLAGKNGYECAQVLICTEEDVSFDVYISDLVDENGESYFANNIEIFAEKFIYLDRNWQTNGLPTGNYPDALIPIEKAKIYGENVVKANTNRGIWLELFIPKEQKAGVYTGTLTVQTGQTLSIPVRLEVLNIIIPDHTGAQSLFHTNYEHMAHYEKGDMPELYGKYLQYLLKHRICQTDFSLAGYDDAGIEQFCQDAADMCRQGYNTINIPSVDKVIDNYTTFDEKYITKYCVALAKKSLEVGIDLPARIAFYDWRIDEPFCCNYYPGQVESAVERFREATAQAAEICKADPAFDSVFGQQVAESVRNACHVITDYYERAYFPATPRPDRYGKHYSYPREKVTLCPKFDGYDTQDQIEQYEPCQKRWWYGCNTPGAPFVGYHIDDAVFSPRIIGGLQARYHVEGNLYWANNIYTEVNTTGQPLWLDDPYQTAHRGSGANGEGALLYPGSFYGVDGPIGCIRLKNIREGYQDFDVFRQVIDRYQALGSSFEAVYDRMTSSLRQGTKIDSIHGDYTLVHEALLRLSEAALSNLGLTLQAVLNEDSVCYILKTLQPCSVYVEGKRIAEDNGAFCISMPYLTDGWFLVKIRCDEVVREIPLFQGKGVDITINEVLFSKGAVTSNSGEVILNKDEVRREITVNLEKPGEIRVDLGSEVKQGETLGFEIRTTQPCYVTVYAEGYEQEKRRFMTIPRWNRIEIPTNTKDFLTHAVVVQFEEAGKYGFGAVYVHR